MNETKKADREEINSPELLFKRELLKLIHSKADQKIYYFQVGDKVLERENGTCSSPCEDPCL